MATIALVLSLPFLFLALLLIVLADGGNPIFIQTRIGRNGLPFKMYKVRTMVRNANERLDEVIHENIHADPRFVKIRRDPRVLPVGRFLRRFSIDELPQFVNVLLGDMSVVGPRPLPPEEDQLVPTYAATRRFVKPGITGLWQVSGRNALTFSEMIDLDCTYARDPSFMRDISIMMATLPAMIFGQEDC